MEYKNGTRFYFGLHELYKKVATPLKTSRCTCWSGRVREVKTGGQPHRLSSGHSVRTISGENIQLNAVNVEVIRRPSKYLLSTMKLLWAVTALLLSCWRADASTGKNSVSAMLFEDVDFALTANIIVINLFV